VEEIAARAADLLREVDGEQPGPGGLPVQLARHLAGTLPTLEIRDDFPFGKRSDRLPQQLVLDAERRHSNASGRST